VNIHRSIGGRLILLVSCQATSAALLVLAALQSGHTRMWLAMIGIIGTLVSVLIGLRVRNAIAPRIQRMVAQVRRFQESGVHERFVDNGRDEITLLGNALDAGFRAIAERDREREQFLAIVAHELKTPVTSIRGYASLLVSNPNQPSIAPRAIEIINRQSWRLSRLIESVFLGLRARSGTLRFQPKPFDMSALVQRVLQELKPFIAGSPFSFKVKERIAILGDEGLLEQALWNLFTCVSVLSCGRDPVHISLATTGQFASLAVDLQGWSCSIDEIEELFIPFKAIEYENDAGVRSAVGLYLSREIVRVHNGHLRVHKVSDIGPEFLMELPL